MEPIAYADIFSSYSSAGLSILNPAFGRPALIATPKNWYLVDPLARRVATSGSWMDVERVHKKYKLATCTGAWLKLAAADVDEQAEAWQTDIVALHSAAGMAEQYGYHVPHQKTVRVEVEYLGGFGIDLAVYSSASVIVDRSGTRISDEASRWQWPHSQLLGFQLGGVGAYQTGGGWVGGGFGLAGALQGAAMASVFNALTTRTHNDCIFRLVFPDAELTFQVDYGSPADLELRLSALAAWLRQNGNAKSGSVMGFSGGALVRPPPPTAQPLSPDSSQPFCTSCGHPRRAQGRFCGQCGAPADAGAAPAPT